jgi:glycosyltransferase involved in cell wall biosynthesis
MKILFLSSLLPHPYADHAYAFWAFKLIKHLSQRHDISVLSFVRSEEERQHAMLLTEYCRRVETVTLSQNVLRKFWVRAKLLTFTPIAVSHGYSREMRDRIRTFVREGKFDIVHMDNTPMAQYVSEINGSATTIHILDLIFFQSGKIVENLGFSRKKLEWLVDSFLSRYYEPRLYARFDRVFAVSSKMKDMLHERNPSIKVSVIPPGVDIPERAKTHNNGKGSNLVFMGAMWRPQNIDAVIFFYRQIFGLIRKAVPDVRLHIVGGSPSEEIRKLASDRNVVVTGYVEDLVSYYLNCDVSIAPMRIGGGIQCKILDAMAAGLPVITTSAGNGGIGARPGEEIVIANSPGEFAEQTITLLNNGNLRKTVSQRGLDFVRKNYCWEEILKRLETIYEECLSSPKLIRGQTS